MRIKGEAHLASFPVFDFRDVSLQQDRISVRRDLTLLLMNSDPLQYFEVIHLQNLIDHYCIQGKGYFISIHFA